MSPDPATVCCQFCVSVVAERSVGVEDSQVFFEFCPVLGCGQCHGDRRMLQHEAIPRRGTWNRETRWIIGGRPEGASPAQGRIGDHR